MTFLAAMSNDSLDSTLSAIVRGVDLPAIVGRYTVVSPRHDGMSAAHCPFHTTRTASMVVDSANSICYCRECGGEWGPVDFVMRAESVDYRKAIEMLALEAAVAVNFEVGGERAATVEPQTYSPDQLMAANRFAVMHFHDTLTSTDEGRDIGLAYFRERNINDAMIERFKLGYSLESRSHFFEAATAASHPAGALAEIGLVVATDRGEHYDRYHGRVVFPVFTVSGEPVAFGARVLRTDRKDVAKYVNSPESVIYSKSNELYGLYQARDAIVERGRCILVEGYMDVISMHQAGIENVVAASGTSLTEGQVSLLKRFTDRVIVIFDADAAGVKASVRSIDMLLSADMEVSLVSLPEGEDPDSYSRSHTREQIESYLEDHAIDFVDFKMALGAERVKKDPIERARLIGDIISSIATIPDRRRMRHFVTRTAFAFKMNERTLVDQLLKRVNERVDRRHQRQRADRLGVAPGEGAAHGEGEESLAAQLRSTEEELLGYVVRNAMLFFCDTVSEGGDSVVPTSVIDFVDSELTIDNLRIYNRDFAALFSRALEVAHGVTDDDLEVYRSLADTSRDEFVARRREALMERSIDMATLDREERLLGEEAERVWNDRYDQLSAGHVARVLLADPDAGIRALTAKLLRPHEVLSRIHTRTTVVESERQRLGSLIPNALCVIKLTVVKDEIDSITAKMSTVVDPDEIRAMMQRRIELDKLKTEFARFLGNRVMI